MKPDFALIRVWKDALFGCLEERLRPLEFTLRKNSQVFHRRRQKNTREGFHLNFGSYPSDPRLEVIVSAAVRHDEVEKLVLGWRTDLNEPSKRETATIGQELGHLVDGRTRSWRIIDRNEIAATCEEIWRLIQRVGLPYVERFSDLRAVLEALSSENSPYADPFPAVRCHHLPVLRALLDGPENAVPAFREQYNRLRQLDDPNVRDYPRFVSYMEKQLGVTIPL